MFRVTSIDSQAVQPTTKWSFTMANILVLKSSILGQYSQSNALIDGFLADHPSDTVTVRDLATLNLPVLDGDQLVLKNYFHIGFAADTPNGLVVPVIRDVDRKSLLQLAHERGIALESGCEQGSCGTCKLTLHEGAVSGNTLGRAVYLCTAYPASRTLVLGG